MYARRILHHGPDPEGTPVLLSDRAIADCWFELLRQGGCGAGSLVLRDRFTAREAIEVGDWISFEYADGVRWYLGRVEERRASSPARIQLRLYGMSAELNQVFPGGFGPQADGARPHRYAATDLFSNDPDRAEETVDPVAGVDNLVTLLLQQYVTTQTHVNYDPLLIESPARHVPVASLKLRGEESVRSVLKDLAVRAGGMSWGVDTFGKFFFLRPRDETLLTLRDGDNLTSLDEVRDSGFLINRLLLTGDYVYDVIESSGQIARRSYRWRGNFYEPDSRVAHGDRRLRLWIPWIRTQEDALAFSREFFRTYARPTSRYLVETVPVAELPIPWLGRVRLEARDGSELTTARVQSIRVRFEHAPVLRMELGPEDPRELWPEPPHDERWERPEAASPIGGDVPLTSLNDGGGDGSSRAIASSSEIVVLSSDRSDSSDASEGSEGSDASTGSSESITSSWDDSAFSRDGSSSSGAGESSLFSSGVTASEAGTASAAESTAGNSDVSSGSATASQTAASSDGNVASSHPDADSSDAFPLSDASSAGDSEAFDGTTTSDAAGGSGGSPGSFGNEPESGSDTLSWTDATLSGSASGLESDQESAASSESSPDSSTSSDSSTDASWDKVT